MSTHIGPHGTRDVAVEGSTGRSVGGEAGKKPKRDVGLAASTAAGASAGDPVNGDVARKIENVPGGGISLKGPGVRTTEAYDMPEDGGPELGGQVHDRQPGHRRLLSIGQEAKPTYG